ncbi:delta(3,5)-Delta(2,4)-dienoyl-CoA isomerase, mitochondrial-like [Clavelina lepadiformis]|uniref:Uncharacterized protein n=1 Tax=Clavelina lepadiformis TaxID=159417 RepID=A0ABP0GQM3_CLALP
MAEKVSVESYKYDTLQVSSPIPYLLIVKMVSKGNLMNFQMWKEMSACFNQASNDETVRVVILSGAGDTFTNGLDLEEAAAALAPKPGHDAARSGFKIYDIVGIAQECTNAIEKCVKPVIAAVNGACYGGGLDVITACDIRLCVADAVFAVKELDVAIAQDMGTLQRLPKVVANDSLVRELCFTGRDFTSSEALACGLVSKVSKDSDALWEEALQMAELIAKKSPIGVQGSKVNLNFSRNHSIPDGLAFNRAWNAVMLQTEDIGKAAASPDATFTNI